MRSTPRDMVIEFSWVPMQTLTKWEWLSTCLVLDPSSPASNPETPTMLVRPRARLLLSPPSPPSPTTLPTSLSHHLDSPPLMVQSMVVLALPLPELQNRALGSLRVRLQARQPMTNHWPSTTKRQRSPRSQRSVRSRRRVRSRGRLGSRSSPMSSFGTVETTWRRSGRSTLVLPTARSVSKLIIILGKTRAGGPL